MKAIIKSTLILLMITLASGFLLGFVNDLTKDSIEQRNNEAKIASLQSVVGEEYRVDLNDALEVTDIKGFEHITIEEAYKVFDADNKFAGVVMLLFTTEGYGDEMELSLGVLHASKSGKEGKISGIDFLSLNETPGLGMNADEADFKDQFRNKAAEALSVTKNTAAEDEIEAISGATITSNAVTEAVNAGLAFYNQLTLEEGI